MTNLAESSMGEKLLYTSFLLLMGIGYLMALVYLYTSHAGYDGKPGVSVEDIAYTYYGNRSGTRLEAAIRGSMAAYLQDEERHHIVAWLKSGAPQSEYEIRIRPILAKNCLACHGAASGTKIPDLSSFAGLREFIQMDTGVSLQTLVKLSHVHLFGIGLMLLGIGIIFLRATLRPWLKYSLVLLPFAAVLSDVLAWFLTKWDPAFAYTVIAAGAVLGLSLVCQILISLYQIWLSRPGETPMSQR